MSVRGITAEAPVFKAHGAALRSLIPTTTADLNSQPVQDISRGHLMDTRVHTNPTRPGRSPRADLADLPAQARDHLRRRADRRRRRPRGQVSPPAPDPEGATMHQHAAEIDHRVITTIQTADENVGGPLAVAGDAFVRSAARPVFQSLNVLVPNPEPTPPNSVPHSPVELEDSEVVYPHFDTSMEKPRLSRRDEIFWR